MRFLEYPGHACAANGTCSSRQPWKAHEARQSRESEFAMMQRAYRRTGGLAHGDEIARVLGERRGQPISTVARWIVSRTVISFDWHSQILLPLSQFDATDMLPRPAIAAVVRELIDVFNDWDLAVWFAQPNGWLRDAAPVDAIARNASDVLSAARAERFVARG